jgi:hypothetical protein
MTQRHSHDAHDEHATHAFRCRSPSAVLHHSPGQLMISHAIRRIGLVVFTALVVVACTKKDTAATVADSSGTTASAPRVVDVGAETAVADTEKATGTVTVSGAKPAAGDGVVQITRRAKIELPGVSSAFAIEGVSGGLQHGFLVTFDSAGAVKIITHKWSNADNSVVAQTDCGSREKCPAAQVTADPKTGAVTFTGLVLTGMDGNTAQPATSTLTGTVK